MAETMKRNRGPVLLVGLDLRTSQEDVEKVWQYLVEKLPEFNVAVVPGLTMAQVVEPIADKPSHTEGGK